ncbi:hypothetical protein O9993_23100 [Vibrio lentus]|nr:hypothetical protein [Vibrio lentus]
MQFKNKTWGVHSENFLAIFAAQQYQHHSSMGGGSAGYTGEQYPTKIKLEKERGYSNDNNSFANR